MNLKRAAILGVVLWVLIFFEVSVLMIGLGLASGPTYYIPHFILLSIFVIVLSFMYFTNKEQEKKSSRQKTKTKAKKVKNTPLSGLMEGLLLGIIFVIVGMALDAVLTVPLFVKSYTFFNDVTLLMGYMLTVVLCAIVGIIKRW